MAKTLVAPNLSLKDRKSRPFGMWLFLYSHNLFKAQKVIYLCGLCRIRRAPACRQAGKPHAEDASRLIV